MNEYKPNKKIERHLGRIVLLLGGGLFILNLTIAGGEKYPKSSEGKEIRVKHR